MKLKTLGKGHCLSGSGVCCTSIRTSVQASHCRIRKAGMTMSTWGSSTGDGEAGGLFLLKKSGNTDSMVPKNPAPKSVVVDKCSSETLNIKCEGSYWLNMGQFAHVTRTHLSTCNTLSPHIHNGTLRKLPAVPTQSC